MKRLPLMILIVLLTATLPASAAESLEGARDLVEMKIRGIPRHGRS